MAHNKGAGQPGPGTLLGYVGGFDPIVESAQPKILDRTYYERRLVALWLSWHTELCGESIPWRGFGPCW